MERIAFKDIPKGVVERLTALGEYLQQSSVDIHLLELMHFRISQINKCAYCVDMHYKKLRHAGETELRLSCVSVWEQTSFFSEKERAVLHFAEVLTELSSKDFTDNTFAVLTPFFSNDEICDIALAVAQINAWNRLVKTCNFTPGSYRVEA